MTLQTKEALDQTNYKIEGIVKTKWIICSIVVNVY